MGAFFIFLNGQFYWRFLKLSNTIIDNNKIERLSSVNTIGVTKRRIIVPFSFSECFSYLGIENFYLQNIPIYLFKATFVEIILISEGGGGLKRQVACLAGQKSNNKSGHQYF